MRAAGRGRARARRRPCWRPAGPVLAVARTDGRRSGRATAARAVGNGPGQTPARRLAAAPGRSIAEIGRLLPMSAQNISQMTARLERLGLIERRLGARGYGGALFLTDEGTRVRAAAEERLRRLDAALTDALGAERHADLVSMLEG